MEKLLKVCYIYRMFNCWLFLCILFKKYMLKCIRLNLYKCYVVRLIKFAFPCCGIVIWVVCITKICVLNFINICKGFYFYNKMVHVFFGYL